MPEQPSMLEDAATRAARLVTNLDRDAVAMKPPATRLASFPLSNESMIEGERLIAAAGESARALAQALRKSADLQAKTG